MEIKLHLNNHFYKIEAIRQALSDFKDICSGRVVDCSFKIELNSLKDVANLKQEFSNYVLGIMINNFMC